MAEFTKYGTDPKMDELVDSEDYKVRGAVVEQGYGLDKLINDPDWWIRKKVAEQGYGLDVLVNDKRWEVCVTVARQGYGLDVLINNGDWTVRRAVVEQGYNLDILINDKNSSVREAVAKQDYGLNILINDEHLCVRAAVAERGYGLNVLVDDEEGMVRNNVSNYLKEHKYKSIADWAAAEPDKVHNANTQDFKVQEDLKDFIYKIDDSSKLKVESSYDSIDEFFDAHNSNSDDFDELIICAVDTKTPIIKIQKTTKENKTEFKFLVDITDEEGDRFLIQTTIKSKEQLNTKIQETVGALRLYKEFSKYADDLEDCL